MVIAASNGVCARCNVHGPRPDCPKCRGTNVMDDGRACTRCKLTVNHKNGNPDDNRPSNLEAAHNTPCNSHWLPSTPVVVERRRSQAW